MTYLLDRASLLIMSSAFAVALLCVLPETRGVFPLWIIAAGANIGDTMFHELGHTLFNWLFGQPAIPMIFTLFGADQWGGMSMTFMERSWLLQVGAFAALAYGCYWGNDKMPGLFIPAVIFSLAIAALAFSGYHELVVSYMGHGSSIAMGGFFLYRGWAFLDSRNQFERWLNGFFGFFLTLYNMHFSYALAFDGGARADYIDHAAFGVFHNDFWKMVMDIPSWSVRGIAIFTIGYAVAAIIGSFALAWYLEEEI